MVSFVQEFEMRSPSFAARLALVYPVAAALPVERPILANGN